MNEKLEEPTAMQLMKRALEIARRINEIESPAGREACLLAESRALGIDPEQFRRLLRFQPTA